MSRVYLTSDLSDKLNCILIINFLSKYKEVMAACQARSQSRRSPSVGVSVRSQPGVRSARQFLSSILGFKLEIWESLILLRPSHGVRQNSYLSPESVPVRRVILVNFLGELLVFVSIRVKTRKRERIKTRVILTFSDGQYTNRRHQREGLSSLS